MTSVNCVWTGKKNKGSRNTWEGHTLDILDCGDLYLGMFSGGTLEANAIYTVFKRHRLPATATRMALDADLPAAAKPSADCIPAHDLTATQSQKHWPKPVLDSWLSETVCNDTEHLLLEVAKYGTICDTTTDNEYIRGSRCIPLETRWVRGDNRKTKKVVLESRRDRDSRKEVRSGR